MIVFIYLCPYVCMFNNNNHIKRDSAFEKGGTWEDQEGGEIRRDGGGKEIEKVMQLYISLDSKRMFDKLIKYKVKIKI